MAPDGRKDGRTDMDKTISLCLQRLLSYGSGRTEGWTDGHGQNYIPPPSAGDNKAQFLRTYVISLYHMLSLYEVKPFIWMLRRTDQEQIMRSIFKSVMISHFYLTKQ